MTTPPIPFHVALWRVWLLVPLRFQLGVWCVTLFAGWWGITHLAGMPFGEETSVAGRKPVSPVLAAAAIAVAVLGTIAFAKGWRQWRRNWRDADAERRARPGGKYLIDRDPRR